MKNLFNLADLIRRQHANVKFWFISWKKDRDFVLLTKMRDAIEVLKDLINKVNSSTEHEDRVMAASVKKEIDEIEFAISKTPVFSVK